MRLYGMYMRVRAFGLVFSPFVSFPFIPRHVVVGLFACGVVACSKRAERSETARRSDRGNTTM